MENTYLAKLFSGKNKYLTTVVSFRVTVSLLMLWYPLEALLASMLLDVLDSFFFAFANFDKKQYHNWDKALDYLHYLILLIVICKSPIFLVAVGLLVFRSIGHYLFNKTGDHRLFIIFPNIYEYYVLAYLLIIRFDIVLSINSWQIWLGLFLFKLAQEYYVHFMPLDTAFKVVPWLRKKFTNNRRR